MVSDSFTATDHYGAGVEKAGVRRFHLLDLFSGIGGFSLGLERSGNFQTVAFCEIEPFPRRVLKKHWPDVPIYEDVRTLTAERLAADGISVDAICGGFPCQPFSTASHGRRVAPDLWPEMLRVVDATMPAVVIAENVGEAPISNAAAALRDRGYRTVVKRISADDAGADHQRDRWWACAYSNLESELHGPLNAEVAKLSALRRSIWSPENYARAIRVPDGLPHRLDRPRIEALGNAVMPVVVAAIGRAFGPLPAPGGSDD